MTSSAPYGSGRFDQPKKQDGQKRNDNGNGRGDATQSSRGGRARRGRNAKNQKMPAGGNNLSTPKSASRVSSKSSPTQRSGKIDNNESLVKDTNDSRLPPFSPFSQSLFTCEMGTSDWTLPSLPAVTPHTKEQVAMPSLTPAFTYQNPFATPSSYSPSTYDSAESITPSLFQDASANAPPGLWHSVQPTATTGERCDLKPLTTTKPPLRPPPGLSAPPGFSEASLPQPILSSSPSQFSTPVRTLEKTPTTPVFIKADHAVSPLVLPRIDYGGPLGTPQSTTSSFSGIGGSLVKENPFAGERGNTSEAECRIEAELQELGGQMIGSILDF